jgi:hypothetical protein
VRRRRPSALYSVLEEEQLLDAVDLTDHPDPLAAGRSDAPGGADDGLPGVGPAGGFPRVAPDHESLGGGRERGSWRRRRADRRPAFGLDAACVDGQGDWDDWSPDIDEPHGGSEPDVGASPGGWVPDGEDSEWEPDVGELPGGWVSKGAARPPGREPDDVVDPSSSGRGGGGWRRRRSVGVIARDARRRRLALGLLGALILVVLVTRGIGEVLAGSGGPSTAGPTAGGPVVGALSAVSRQAAGGPLVGALPAVPRQAGRRSAPARGVPLSGGSAKALRVARAANRPAIRPARSAPERRPPAGRDSRPRQPAAAPTGPASRPPRASSPAGSSRARRSAISPRSDGDGDGDGNGDRSSRSSGGSAAEQEFGFEQ